METVMLQSGFKVHKYRQSRLDTYYSRMSQDNEHVLVDGHIARVLREQGFDVEEDPRSVYSVEKLFQALNKYSPKYATQPIEDQHLQSGINLAYACFGRAPEIAALTPFPFSVEEISRLTTSKTSSAGLTAYGCSKSESVVRAFERGKQTLLRVKSPEPCLAFKRTQFGGKTRLVWGYPYSMTAIEGIFARPLLDAFKKGTTPLAFAQTTGVIGSKLRRASYRKNWVYSIDMSSFDSSVSSKLIDVAFRIMATWFDMDSSIKIQTGEEISARDVYQQIQTYFKTCPIVMPDGNIYKGRKHGVPSGSYFTQAVDSIVNVIIAGTVSSKFHMGIDRSEIQVLGDDMLFWSNKHISLKLIADYASATFGVTFNPEKSQCVRWDQAPHFLGRNWERGVPDLPVQEVLTRLKFPETFRKYPSDPDYIERQVRLIIASMAASYRSAWKLILDLYFNNGHGIRHVAHPPASVDFMMKLMIDKPHMYYAIRKETYYDINPDYLSGLIRYRLKYEDDIGRDRPIPLLLWV